MKKLNRDPEVTWRVEHHREERAREILAGPETPEPEDQVDSLGTVTLLAGGVMHQLNLLAGEIWKLCDGSRNRDEIVSVLLELFDVEETALREDLDLFLDEMIGKGLIHEG